MIEKKKRVLMFCPNFFGYEKRLSEAIREEGYEVDLYDERPSNGFFGKVFLRLNFKPYKAVVQKYIRSVISQNKDKKYDYVLVVKSEAAGEKELALLRDAYPTAKFILYLWDSVENVPDGEKKIPLYDRVLTFDPEDAKKYNIPFLPMPYGKEYIQTETPLSYQYDIAFIGTAHSIRPKVVKTLQNQCKNKGLKCFTYFYSPHILVFLLNKLTNRNYKYLSTKEINFKPLSTAEVCRIYSASKCVLDIEHPKQKGTTTRPVEMLPMQKKIITTNLYVKKFEFYHENNFYLIDRDNPIIDDDFFKSDYQPVKKEIIEKYSPKTFVKSLFDN